MQFIPIEVKCEELEHKDDAGEKKDWRHIGKVLTQVLKHENWDVAVVLELSRESLLVIDRLIELQDPVGLEVHGDHLEVHIVRDEVV